MTNQQKDLTKAVRERRGTGNDSLSAHPMLEAWIAEILSEELSQIHPGAECAFSVTAFRGAPIEITGWAVPSFPPSDDPVDLIRDRMRLRFGADHPICRREILWSAKKTCRRLPEIIYAAAVSRDQSEAEGERRVTVSASALSSPITGRGRAGPERVLAAFVRYIAQTLVVLGLCRECKASASFQRGSGAIRIVNIAMTEPTVLTRRQVLAEIKFWDLSIEALHGRLRLSSISLPYAIENGLAGDPPEFGPNLSDRPYFCDSWLFGRALKDPSFRIREKPQVDCSQEGLALYLQSRLLKGVTAADLINGRSLEGKAVFKTDEGCIEEVSIETMLSEWIFRDAGEIPLLRKVEDIWEGEAGIETLTQEECEQILELGRTAISVSIYDGSQRRVLFEGDDREHEPVENDIEVPEYETFEERLMRAAALEISVRDIDCRRLPANQLYRERFGRDLPQWLNLCPRAEEAAGSLADLCLVYGRALPEEPPCARDRKAFRDWLARKASGRSLEDIAREHLLVQIREVLARNPPQHPTYLQGMRYLDRQRRYRNQFGKGVPKWAAELSPNRGNQIVGIAMSAGVPLPDRLDAGLDDCQEDKKPTAQS